MGYKTFFSLGVDVNTDQTIVREMVKALLEMDEDVEYVLDSDGGSQHEVTWDNHEEMLSDLSRQYPDTVLSLWGEGEDAGDLWVKYFYNGRVHRVETQITYAPFDASKLAEPVSRWK